MFGRKTVGRIIGIKNPTWWEDNEPVWLFIKGSTRGWTRDYRRQIQIVTDWRIWIRDFRFQIQLFKPLGHKNFLINITSLNKTSLTVSSLFLLLECNAKTRMRIEMEKRAASGEKHRRERKKKASPPFPPRFFPLTCIILTFQVVRSKDFRKRTGPFAVSKICVWIR